MFRKWILQVMPHYNYTKRLTTVVSNLMNHEKTSKHRRVPSTGETALKVVTTSSSKIDALKVTEFQIAVSIICHSAVRFVDHLGENMAKHGKGQNFMFFNNLAFFGHGLAFFLKRCLATL